MELKAVMWIQAAYLNPYTTEFPYIMHNREIEVIVFPDEAWIREEV